MSKSESASSDRSIFSKCRMWILHITLSQGHLLETWVTTAWNFTPHIRSTQWPPSTSQSLINRNEADMRYLKFSALQICLSITGTQHSLTLCWFFLKLCVSCIHKIRRRDLRRSLIPPPEQRSVSCEVR